MVEGVEHIGRDFEAVLLTEFRLFSDAHVEASYAEAAHWPAPARSAIRGQEDGTKVLDSRTRVGKIVDPRADVAGAAIWSVAGRANTARAADIFMHASAEGVGIHRWDGTLGNAKDESSAQ